MVGKYVQPVAYRISETQKVLEVRGRPRGAGHSRGVNTRMVVRTLTPGRGEVSSGKSSIFALLFALIGSLHILVHDFPASMFRSCWIILRGWAGGTPVHVTQTKVFELPGAALSPASRRQAAGEGAGLDARPSANSAKYNPSFLSLAPVSISTNIQRPANVLA